MQSGLQDSRVVITSTFSRIPNNLEPFAKVLQRKKMDGYRVDYWINYGFAGAPGHGDYVLNQYAAFPLFIQKIDSAQEQRMQDDCKIQFTQSGMIFNKCEGKIDSAS